MKKVLLLATIALVFVFVGPSFCQDKEKKSDIDALLKQSFKEAEVDQKKPPIHPFLQQTDPEKLPDDVKKSYYATMKEELEDAVWSMKHKRAIYETQYWAGIVVFVVSIAVVILGLLMSWLQFYAYYRLMQTTTKAKEQVQNAAQEVAKSAPDSAKTALENLSNQIKLSTSGIEITTPIVGIIILALSLAFFYMYLHFVFPIK